MRSQAEFERRRARLDRDHSAPHASPAPPRKGRPRRHRRRFENDDRSQDSI